MPRYREIKNNYTSGEVDPFMVGRADNKHYFNGAESMRNVLVIPQGGYRLRGGLAYLDTVPDNSSGDPSDTRLIGFQKSTEQHYMMMLVDAGYRVYKAGELMTVETGETWQDYELSDIGWTQNLDTLLIFHDQRRPRALQRQGGDADWGSFNWVLKNIPQFAFPGTTYMNGVNEVQRLAINNIGAGESFTLTLAGEETQNILVGSTSVTRLNIETALRDLGATSATGITVTDLGGYQFRITFGGDDGQRPWGALIPVEKTVGATTPAFFSVSTLTAGKFPGEDVWSDVRGWPRCGTFSSGRLYMGGSLQRPQTTWASRAGDETDFNAEETAADYGIDFTISSDDVSSIHGIFVGRHIQVFTSSGEFYIPVSGSEPVTPENVSVRRTTQRGSKKGMPVFDVEGATMFVQPDRRTDENGYQRGVAVREFVFADGEQAYNANNVSLLAAGLIRDPRRWAVRRATTFADADVVFSANQDDGSMTAFCSLRSQEINAHTLLQTRGRFTDVGVDGDDVCVVVERVIGGVTYRFFEQFVPGLMVDCGVYNFAVPSPVSIVTGLDHLEGETVWVRVDDVWRDNAVVAGGGVLLDPPAEVSYQVGLPWPVVDEETGYVWQVGDLPIAADLADGPIMGRKRRLVESVFQLFETRTFLANGNRFTKKVLGENVLDTPDPKFTGQWRRRGMLGWAKGGRMKVGDIRPDDVTILAQAKAVGV